MKFIKFPSGAFLNLDNVIGAGPSDQGGGRVDAWALYVGAHEDVFFEGEDAKTLLNRLDREAASFGGKSCRTCAAHNHCRMEEAILNAQRLPWSETLDFEHFYCSLHSTEE